jgi:anti-sigma factor RsiW
MRAHRPTASGPTAVTCQEAIGLLADYLDRLLTAEAARRLDGHMADCDECRAFLSTYERARDVAARVGRVEMPEEMKARLRRFLLDELERARGGSSPPAP